MRQFTKIQAKADRTAEILIYEEIGESFFGGLGAKAFVEQLKGLGDVDSITVRINSPGGAVFDGTAIYNALKAHPAKKNVVIDGLAASIASVIAMAGDSVEIAENAMMMIHNPWALCMGDQHDMIKLASVLEKIKSSTMSTAYQRSGKSPEELSLIMDEETWYTGQEAVDAGFADNLTEPIAATASFDLSRFKKAPKQAENRAKPSQKVETESESISIAAHSGRSLRILRERLRLADE